MNELLIYKPGKATFSFQAIKLIKNIYLRSIISLNEIKNNCFLPYGSMSRHLLILSRYLFYIDTCAKSYIRWIQSEIRHTCTCINFKGRECVFVQDIHLSYIVVDARKRTFNISLWNTKIVPRWISCIFLCMRAWPYCIFCHMSLSRWSILFLLITWHTILCNIGNLIWYCTKIL